MQAAERLVGLQAALEGLETGDPAQSVAACRRLLASDANDIEARLLLGLAVGVQGDVRQAARLLDHVARARPDNAHPCRDLAEILLRRGKASLIAPQYRACLALAPDDPRLCYPFAELQRENGEADAAVALLEPVLRARPNSAEAHCEMGLALAEAGRFADAAERFRRAVAIDPGPAVGWANLGMMLKVEGEFDAALDAYAEALARTPDDMQIRVNRAVTRLHAGRLAEAWQDDEWRLVQPGGSVLPPEQLLPPLSRMPDLTGRTVLVLQEEGFGDSIQFLRYLPLLAARGARVVAVVPPALVQLLRTIPGVAEVPDGDAAVPAFDFHSSFNGLPRAFEATLETIPCDVPYIVAVAELAAAWAARLPLGETVRVGLVWAGQARPWLPGFAGLDRRRSTSLATLAPLAATQGVRFISLQKGPAAREIAAPDAGLDVFDPMGEVRDFAETAAIIANLDLVISVDTSVVHLAGAMGKPVFLLDRYDNCWRWLRDREDSPWYPTLRIFRQRQSGDWESVICRVAAALSEFVAARSVADGRPCQEPRSAGAA